MFINTLPVRLKLQGASVLEAMRTAQGVLVGMLKYEQTALAVAQRCSGMDNGVALFSAMPELPTQPGFGRDGCPIRYCSSGCEGAYQLPVCGVG